mgnify:CR=1 FL=1
MANPSSTLELNTINSLTLPKISRMISDNITARIPMFYFLNKAGHKEYESGGIEYRFSVFKELPNAVAYTGSTVLTPSERDLVSSAVLYRKQFSTDITLTGTSLLKNSGNDETAVADLIAAQIEMAEEIMKGTLAGSTYGCFSDEAYSDLGITGFQTMLSTSTTTGTYAGLDRASYSYWRHNSDSVSTGFNTDGLISMRTLQLACARGDEAPAVIVMTATGYSNLCRALTGTISYNNPTPNTQFADAGFEHVNFFGSPVIYDDGVPTNQAFFVNTKYVKLLVHQDRDMAVRDFITPTDMDAIVGRLYWAGNLVCNNLARQGILQGSIETWA